MQQIPLAVRLRDECGQPLPQMIAQRRARLEQQQIENHRNPCGTGTSRMFDLFDPYSRAHWIAFIVLLLLLIAVIYLLLSV